MSNELQAIATNMRIGRAERRWSQADLSDECGIPKSSIARYENAESNMGLDQLVKIADAFGWPLDRLVGRERKAS